jgi:hypothetical protein
MLTEQEIARLSPDERRALSDYLSGGKKSERYGTELLGNVANASDDPGGQGVVHAERIADWVRGIIKTESGRTDFSDRWRTAAAHSSRYPKNSIGATPLPRSN